MLFSTSRFFTSFFKCPSTSCGWTFGCLSHILFCGVFLTLRHTQYFITHSTANHFIFLPHKEEIVVHLDKSSLGWQLHTSDRDCRLKSIRTVLASSSNLCCHITFFSILPTFWPNITHLVLELETWNLLHSLSMRVLFKFLLSIPMGLEILTNFRFLPNQVLIVPLVFLNRMQLTGLHSVNQEPSYGDSKVQDCINPLPYPRPCSVQ